MSPQPSDSRLINRPDELSTGWLAEIGMTETALVMTHHDRCSHGITWDTNCIQCELVQCYNFVQTWGPKVDKARARMHEIQKTLRRKRNKQEPKS